jgi:hypothetical protein
LAGYTDYSATRMLQHIVGRTAFTMPSVWLALFTTAGVDAGTGFTEVTGGSYARPTTSALWNAAVAGSPLPSTITNSGTIAFPAATANWGTVTAWGLFDAVTAGNLLFWDYMGNFSWLPFTATLASPAVLTSTGHGYANGDQVVVSAEYGGVLPSTAGSWSGLLTVAGVTADSFTAGVNSTSTGDGLVRKVLPQIINSGVTASFAASTLTLSQA